MRDTELHFMNALLLISQKATYAFPGFNSQDRECYLKNEKKKVGEESSILSTHVIKI